MNYQEMSDTQINVEVAKALGFDSKPFLEAVESGDKPLYGERFDPCNSWADAGPIIQENRITIINENLSIPVAVNDCYGWYCDEDKPLHCRNENPLRAAMILFLMMKGGE